uniref:Uncharacterized protein n=1 Tax=Panagrolaimus sp. JU765 TaxID=591449 RepID=A0AC34PYC6_9BILA
METKIPIFLEDAKQESVTNFTSTKIFGFFVLISLAFYSAQLTSNAIHIVANDQVDGAITTECLIQAHFYKSRFCMEIKQMMAENNSNLSDLIAAEKATYAEFSELIQLQRRMHRLRRNLSTNLSEQCKLPDQNGSKTEHDR